MKVLLIVMSLFFVTACASTPEGRAATECWNEGFTSSPGYDTCFAKKMEAHDLSLRKEQQLADAALCKEYGFKPKTDAFANCMMNVEQSRLQREHELALQKKRADKKGTYMNYHRTAPNRPFQCQTQTMAGGLMTTNCY